MLWLELTACVVWTQAGIYSTQNRPHPVSADHSMKAADTIHPGEQNREAVREDRQPSQLIVVAAVFAAVGFVLTSCFYFSAAKPFILQSIPASLASGLAGVTAWKWICGRTNSLGTGRVVLTGATAGVLFHPFLTVVLALFLGMVPGPASIVLGSLFFCATFGVITVPLGIVATLISVTLGERLRQRSHH